MKVKKIILIIAIVIVYALVYKAWNLLVYTENKGLDNYITEIIECYKEKEKLTIEPKESKKNLEYKTLNINDFTSKYEEIKSDEDKLQYMIYKDESVKKYISIEEKPTYTDIFILGFTDYSEISNSNQYGHVKLYDDEKTYQYLIDNKITGDLKLFDFILDNYKIKLNIFSKVSTMKETYYIKEYIANVLIRINKIYVFDGIKGYMFETVNDAHEVHIENYVLTFRGFTKEEVIELVRTIKIDEEKK